MALNLDLGSVGTVALDADGDLAKRLRPGIDTLVKFNPQTLNFLGTNVADLPTGSVSSDFNFNVGPSWQVSQQVGISQHDSIILRRMELKAIRLEVPDGGNIIVGQSHFIKTVEDIYEAIVNTVPQIKFGVAFCEASGPCLIRVDGNDDAMKQVSIRNAQAAAAGATAGKFRRRA